VCGERLVAFGEAAAGQRSRCAPCPSAACTAAPLLERLPIALCCGTGLPPSSCTNRVGGGDALDVPAVFVAALLQNPRSAPARALQLGDLGAACRELGDLFGLGLFVSGHGLLRRGQDVRSRSDSASRLTGPFFSALARSSRSFVCRDPRGVQHILQAEFFALGSS